MAYEWLRRAPKKMGCARVITGTNSASGGPSILCQEPGRAFWHPTGSVMVLCDDHALTGMVELTLDEYEVWTVMDS
jgi:hypothetical protein